MKVEFINSINDINNEEWNSVINSDYPFLKYEFLESLEKHNCVSEERGWSPFHVVVSENDKKIAIMPMYIKTDSQGEFVFDWSWADAFYRNGVNYYPKLVCSIPYTPASGPRLSVVDKEKTQEIMQVLYSALREISEELDFSSVHILLAEEEEIKSFSDSGFSVRSSYSFHWFNNEYKDFTHFLEDMTSRQRKNIKKERDKISKQDISIKKIKGEDITEDMLVAFYQFYQLTYLKRGMQGYLNYEFFKEITKLIPENILLVMAQDKEESYVAGALNFYDSKKLYGRYWGCFEDFDSLHFETCYYQGIEFCIENNLSSFDPGVQGEHKIKRGFCPIETYSAHWIKDERFREAIDDFLIREQAHVKSYNNDRKRLLPFKKEITEKIYAS